MSKKENIEVQETKIEKVDEKKFKLVVAVVARGFAHEVVAASVEAGNEGAVIIQGRGVGKSEKKFFGLHLEPENEMVLIIVPEELVVKVSKAIYAKFDFKSEARGLVFVLPISNVII